MLIKQVLRNVIFLQALVTLFLLGIGCDTSEDDLLLNPVIPDSIQVRVINLLSTTSIDVQLDGINAAEDLGILHTTSFSPFLTRELFSIVLTGSEITDTISNLQFPLSARNTYHYNYFVAGTDSARQLFTLVSSSFDRSELQEDRNGRVYFINAIPNKSYLLKQGCRSGLTLFDSTLGPTISAARDLLEGEYSFYLFEGTSPSESASARIDISSGASVVLIAAEQNGTPKLFALSLYDPSPSAGPLVETTPEVRQSAAIRILNALENSSISAELIESSAIVAQSVLPLNLSASSEIEICSNSGGDTLLVITEEGDSSRVPLQVDVGGEVTAIVYSDEGGTTDVTTLKRPGGSLKDGTMQVRGLNLTSNSDVAIVAGAGGPPEVEAGTPIFVSPAIGAVSAYRELPVGLYPLSLEQTTSGVFYAGGLHHFNQSFFTLIALEQNGEQSMYVLDELTGSDILSPLLVSGNRVNFFSMSPVESTTFSSTTSIGTIDVSDVAYSYVYPSILPREQVTLAATGAPSVTADFLASGYTVGVTGETNREIFAFPLPTTIPSPGMAGVRFLNAAPGAGTLDIRADSSTGNVEVSAEYGVPTSTLIKDARRQTFSITIGGTNEEVAILSGIELSQSRNYLLIIGPKGPTSSSDAEYGTLWMQE